jgi:hypothetical protein
VCNQKASDLGIEEPVVPRTRRAPRRVEEGSPAHVFSTAEHYYKQQYFQLIDTALSAIKDRFESDTWQFLSMAERALISTPSNTAVLSDFYKDDINAARLELHTTMLHDIISKNKQTLANFGDTVGILKADAAIRSLLPELVKCVRLLLTVPLSSCTAERSFSALRRLKTYMRATMTQTRLNSISILNVHQDYTTNINIDTVMNEFISKSTVRQNTFAICRSQ